MASNHLTELSLYVHIPFCSSRCRYCDFYFETTRSPRVMEATLNRIIEESERAAEAMGHPRIVTVYFGGGTPSILPPDLLDGFLERFRSVWHIGGSGPTDSERLTEWTFESNPESITEELLTVLARNGINRLSVGVQTFQDPLLRLLGRRATREIALDALERTHGFRQQIPHLNIDIIAGIPGQNEAGIREDIALAARFETDHFSLYSLTIEDRTPLQQMIHQGTVSMPLAEVQDDLWFTARDELARSNFISYEVSNFAAGSGAESVHNSRYWRLEPYLGLGPGAVSTIPVNGAAVRIRNPNLFVYGSRSRGGPAAQESETIAPTDFLFEHFITGLRTRAGVSLVRIGSIFGPETVRGLEPVLEDWRARQMLELSENPGDADRISLKPEHRLKLDHYLLELKDGIDTITVPKDVNWPPV